MMSKKIEELERLLMEEMKASRLTLRQVKGNLALTRRTHADLEEQLVYMAGLAKVTADSFLQLVREQLDTLETELNKLDEESSEETLERLSDKISDVSERMRFSPLPRRAIHQRNLHHLSRQMLHSRSILPQAELEKLMQPYIKDEQEKVALLQSKERLTPFDQEILQEHQHHLELYRQILAGERPYAPLQLIHQMDHIEKELAAVDAEIAKGWEKNAEPCFAWRGTQDKLKWPGLCD